MRHNVKTVKLGRTSQHRDAMLANLVCSLIEHSRVKTTLAKAKAAKPLAEKIVTLGKTGTLHARRTALSKIKQENAVKKMFKDIAPKFQDRKGGYTRIVKLGTRLGDAAPVAFLEWVDYVPKSEDTTETTETTATAEAPKLEDKK